jgi:hypothetical protein
MIHNNFFLYSVKIVAELARDILMFPVWWYSRGLINQSISIINFLKDQQKSLALTVWVKNIFTPMYGQRDWQGILVSIFMRIIQIIFRGIAMVFYALFGLLRLFIWLVAPIFVLYEVIFQLF